MLGDGAEARGLRIAIDWRPPFDGDATTARLVADTLGDTRIDVANATAIRFAKACEPVLVAVEPAATALEGFAATPTLLHAGPPRDFDTMCGPMRGALIGAVLLERWADTSDAAIAMLRSGGIRLASCHDFSAVGPIAGVISPSMPVWVVEDGAREPSGRSSTTNRRAFATLNEGLGRVLRFGAFDDSVLDRLRWMQTELCSTLSGALQATGPLPVRPLMAQALHMGDEVHNRNVAATGLLIRRLAVPIVETAPTACAARVLSFVSANDHFFLNISMAACKLTMDAAHGVRHSSIVTAMARNGVDFGVRLSGGGDQWFTAPSPRIAGLYFSGYGDADACADLGDSAITETAGVGAFAMAAAPAIVGFVGGTPADAIRHTQRMREITFDSFPIFTIPSLGFAPTPFGIDARYVIDTGIAPVINTGIAHRDPGIGQIGAGISSAPMACFSAGLRALV